MDDGTYHTNKSVIRNYVFSTHSFPLEDQQTLVQAWRDNFEIAATIQKHRSYYMLYILKKSTNGNRDPLLSIWYDLTFILVLTIKFCNLLTNAHALALTRAPLTGVEESQAVGWTSPKASTNSPLQGALEPQVKRRALTVVGYVDNLVILHPYPFVEMSLPTGRGWSYGPGFNLWHEFRR